MIVLILIPLKYKLDPLFYQRPPSKLNIETLLLLLQTKCDDTDDGHRQIKLL